MVYILPLYHPVRLVQELCMLDNLSAGRLEIGVGRGIRAAEHEWFGLDPTAGRAHHEEMLELLVSAFTTGRPRVPRAFFEMPPAPLDVLPVQRPYPPLWYAGGIEYAARRRLNLLARTPDDVARYWAAPRRGGRRRGDQLNPHLATPTAGLTRHVVVRRSLAEAVAVARRAWPAFQHNWRATPLRLPDGRVTRADEDFDTVLAEGTRLLVGTPATVLDLSGPGRGPAARAAQLYFAPAFQWGDLTFDESLASMTRFAADVMPAFRRCPSTAAGR